MQLAYQITSIPTKAGEMKIIVLRPKERTGLLPGLLWIHGGGYYEGMPEMVRFSRGRDGAKTYGAVIVSPAYRLSVEAPYPAALEDCYDALLWLRDNAAELGVDPERIMVGGESAGGGLTAALCMYARDKKEVRISYQFPIYPMLDCDDTDSSRDNHGLTWNTKKNHEAWKKYLGPLYGSEDIPPYASPAKQKDMTGLPPCYTFVCDGEPFLDETLDYVRALNEAGVPAKADVFHADQHAFDVIMPLTKAAKDARAAFLKNFGKAIGAIDE